jgi:signal transduction histidine kinase
VFDAMRFEQILANYISNAAKYGGPDKRVVISSRTLERVVRIRVFNSGPPISEDVLPHIWDGFFKADDARTRVEGSYGLGLSIVKAIQTVAGQEFGAENADDGVIFWFDVERADA